MVHPAGHIPDGGIDSLSAVLEEIPTAVSPADETPLRERLLIQALIIAQASQLRLREDLERARTIIANPAPAESPELHSLRQSLDALSAQFIAVESEAATLRERLEASRSPVPGAKVNKLEAELTVAAAGLLPRLEFIGNSIRFIAVELPDRALLWKALAALDREERGRPAGWKYLTGHEGWWERHFSTGQDNQGRIYARFTTTTARWQVLVSHKQDQTMDLRWIGRV